MPVQSMQVVCEMDPLMQDPAPAHDAGQGLNEGALLWGCGVGPATHGLSPEAQAFLQQSTHFLHFL